MNTDMRSRRDYRFVKGLVTGTVVGAGLAIWFAPRLASGDARPATPRAV